jgi:hypothetical protein
MPQIAIARQIKRATPDRRSCRVVEASPARPKLTPVLIVYCRFSEAMPRGRRVTPFKSEPVRKSRTNSALATEAARISASVRKRVIMLTLVFDARYPIAYQR